MDPPKSKVVYGGDHSICRVHKTKPKPQSPSVSVGRNRAISYAKQSSVLRISQSPNFPRRGLPVSSCWHLLLAFGRRLLPVSITSLSVASPFGFDSIGLASGSSITQSRKPKIGSADIFYIGKPLTE